MDATVSVSKGVFAFKRRCSENKHPKSKKSRQQNEQGQMPYWPLDDKRSSQQQRNFHACWDSISDRLKKLENEMHQNVFKDLVSFVVSYSSSKYSTSNSCNSMNVGHSIPAAVLVTGINMPDSGTVLSSLEQLLLDEGAAGHIARLHSRDCANIKSCIVSLVSQLVNGTKDDSSDSDDSSCLEEEEEVDKKKSHRKLKLGIKKNNCTMAVLEAWHQEQGVAGSLVVMLEDVESFPTVVLQDLICIASQHRRLPLLLVLCCHTSPAALHSRLTQPTLARLALTVFQGRPSHHYLAQLVTEVLMDEKCSSFRLGGSTFKLLLDMFLCHHLTVNTFVQGLKYCAVQHFLSNGSSVLCCPASQRSAVAARLSATQLNTIRKLTSFREYVESLPNQDKAPLLVNDDKFRRCCVLLLDRQDRYYALLCCAVRVLHLLAAVVPGAPLGRQVWSVLSLCLNSPVVESRGFEEVWRHLEGQARQELLVPLPSLVTLLKTSGLKEVQKVTSDLEEVMEDLLLMDEGEDEQNRPRHQEVKTVASPVKTLLPSDRFKLKEKLQELAKKNQAKPNKFQMLRSQYLSILKEFLTEYAVPPSTQPLHEVTFSSNSSEVMHRLLGKHRTAITKALGDPHHYFQCECCRNSNTEAPVGLGANSPLPDISLAYRLHLECGRLINLYDWLQAFCACAEQETTTDDGDGDGGTDSQPGSVMQARFVQAVSELQFLGFIKTSKRKTDHVARLTWGGC